MAWVGSLCVMNAHPRTSSHIYIYLHTGCDTAADSTSGGAEGGEDSRVRAVSARDEDRVSCWVGSSSVLRHHPLCLSPHRKDKWMRQYQTLKRQFEAYKQGRLVCLVLSLFTLQFTCLLPLSPCQGGPETCETQTHFRCQYMQLSCHCQQPWLPACVPELPHQHLLSSRHNGGVCPFG